MAKWVNHPCVQHKLSLIRDINTGRKEFRELIAEVTTFVCYEALQQLPTRPVSVRTPLAEATCAVIDSEVIIVPILRAGLGMLDSVLALVPTARVGYIGLYRDEQTKQPITYYEKLPPEIKGGCCVIIDPMLATGGSTIAAVDKLKAGGAHDITVVCVVTCPEGLEQVETAHPDVRIYTAAIDSHLNDKKYIVPGLGDAGDRLYGTPHD